MYEHFTDRARKVMRLADVEARCCNHEYIGTEHILLGLITEGSGTAANVLKYLNMDLGTIRRKVEQILQRGPVETMSGMAGKLPQTPRAKKVLGYSTEEARNLNHCYVGTEHLLLALLREEEGLAGHVLRNLGLRLSVVRDEVRTVLSSLWEVAADPALALPNVQIKPKEDLRHLPQPARAIVKKFDQQIERIRRRKGEAVAEQDWETAVHLKDLQDKLRKSRTDFIREWPGNG